MDILLMNLKDLKEHEEVDLKHLKQLKKQIVMDDILKRPIAIDKKTKIILDGEHRFNILKELGYGKVPVVFIDYNSPKILVKSWKNSEKLTKEKIIKVVLNGKKLPPKSSKHMIRIEDKLKHISVLEKRINIPLKELRGD